MLWHPGIAFPTPMLLPESVSNSKLREMRQPGYGGREDRIRIWLQAAAILLLLMPLASHAQISLSTAVDLAEKSSPAVRGAAANVQKAAAGLEESKDVFIPNFLMGGSPGYSYGFPLGYPSLFNVNSQSLVFSFSQPDYIRAAHSALRAARLSLQDTQQQVALDVSLAYVELNHDIEEISALDEEKGYADELVQMEEQRVQAGVDPRVSELETELRAAQVDEKRVHLENDAEEMRQKLAHLTGLPAAGLTTATNSIPAAGSVNLNAADDTQTAESNPGVRAAYANAKSRFYTAFGDKRQNYRPLVSLGAQYSLFAKFNNYSEFFQRFQYNNFGIGFQLTIPLFDATRRAKARESAADAFHAQADADASRDVLSEQTLAMRRSILELNAQQRVAQIQSELAQEQLKTVESELANGSGSANAQPVTPIQAQQAHIAERERYEDMLDANFSVLKVELNLLRMTGQIDNWIRASLEPHNP